MSDDRSIVATLVGTLLGDVHPELNDLHDEMTAHGLRRAFDPLPRRARSAPGGEVRAVVFFGVVTGTEVPNWDCYAGHRSAAEFDAAYAEHPPPRRRPRGAGRGGRRPRSLPIWPELLG